MLIYLQMIDTPEEKSRLEQLYEMYRKAMYHVADKILNNPQDSEDAVHEAFLQIAKNMDKIGEIACPQTKNYVVIIVEHKAIDLYRKKMRYKEVEYTEKAMGFPAKDHPGENRLSRCILKLPARYREAILLRYYHGYSTREIAGVMEITEENAKKLLQRAKKKLEDTCREEGLLP